MKFRLTFKTPDVVDQLDCDESKIEDCVKVVDMWTEYGEYITVEFDTEELTAKVVL